MLVVVQTYPAHFYQTLTCLRSIRALEPHCEIWLLADDFSNFSWPEYTTLCRKIYRPWIDRLIPFSDIPALYRLRSWPWLRQQTNKLLLDRVIDRPHWLFLDGDVVLKSWPDINRVAGQINVYQGVPLIQRDPGPGEMSSQVLFYIAHMLGIDFPGFSTVDGRPITASNPPVKVMRSDILQTLRAHVQSRFGKSLIDVHLDLAADQRMAACEWDLIETYRQIIMREPVVWQLERDWYETTWSADRELGQEWFQARSVLVDPEIWHILPEGKNYL